MDIYSAIHCKMEKQVAIQNKMVKHVAILDNLQDNERYDRDKERNGFMNEAQNNAKWIDVIGNKRDEQVRNQNE